MKNINKKLNETDVIDSTQVIKGHGNRNLFEILQYHVRSKRFIGGLCKVEKNGSLSKINGQVFEIKTTKDNENLAIIDNFFGKKRAGKTKRWQAVLVKNLKLLNENGWRHERIEK